MVPSLLLNPLSFPSFFLLMYPSENGAGIAATKAECVFQHMPLGKCSCPFGNAINPNLRIGLIIYRRQDHAVFHASQSKDSLKDAGGPHCMTYLGFIGTHRRQMIAEDEP
jgi:hypothetical protein